MYLSYEASFLQHAELSTSLRMRRRSSARGTRIFACGDVSGKGSPHAENRSPHAEHRCGDGPPHVKHESLHTETFFHTRKRVSACGKQVSARGTPVSARISACSSARRKRSPHAENRSSHMEHRSLHAEMTRNTSLHMRKRFFARGTRVSACGSTRHAEDNEISAVLSFRTLPL